MKKLICLLPVVLLTGCFATALPVKRNWPDVPTEITAACPDLKKVSEETQQLSDVLKIVVDNYAQYKECKIKVDAWIEWYNTQRKIFDGIK